MIRSGGVCEIWHLIFTWLQYWHSIVFGPLILTPISLIPKWWRVNGPGWPKRRCHSFASPFEPGYGCLIVILDFWQWWWGRWLIIATLQLCSGTYSMTYYPWISCIWHKIELSCLARRFRFPLLSHQYPFSQSSLKDTRLVAKSVQNATFFKCNVPFPFGLVTWTCTSL